MHIIFKGQQNIKETADLMKNMLYLLNEQYGVEGFNDAAMDLTLLNEQGEEVELLDTETSEVLTVLEIYPHDSKELDLRLVVDNTKMKPS